MIGRSTSCRVEIHALTGLCLTFKYSRGTIPGGPAPCHVWSARVLAKADMLCHVDVRRGTLGCICLLRTNIYTVIEGTLSIMTRLVQCGMQLVARIHQPPRCECMLQSFELSCICRPTAWQCHHTRFAACKTRTTGNEAYVYK